MRRTLKTALLTTLLLVSMSAVVSAQTVRPSDLRESIRAALLSDPRTSALSQVQLDAMVQILYKQAQKQGLTAKDVQLQQPAQGQFVSSQNFFNDPCTGAGTLCEMSEALGFIGNDVTIPFYLGMSSMGLIWILAEMMHRRKYPSIVVPATPSFPPPPPPPPPTD